MAPSTAPAKPRTVTHDEILAADPATLSIPPYALSEEWAARPPAEIYGEIMRRRAEKRATSQFLDHADLSLEFMWSEAIQRGRRTEAEQAAEPTVQELEAIAKVEQRRLLATLNLRNAKEQLKAAWRELGIATIHAKRELAEQARRDGVELYESDWDSKPWLRPDNVRQLEREVEALARVIEDGEAAVAAALVQENATKATAAAHSQARRYAGQAKLNDAGFLENVRRSRGNVKEAEKELAARKPRFVFGRLKIR